MNLRQYIDYKGITILGVSRELNINPSELHRILNGSRWPSIGLAKDLIHWSNGLITYESLFKDAPPRNRVSKTYKYKKPKSMEEVMQYE